MRQPVELGGFEYYLDANWDDEGAEAVPGYLLQNARVILCGLPEYLPIGSAMAGIDGSLGIYWTKEGEQGRHAELYIDFKPDGRIRLMYSTGKDNAQILAPSSLNVEWLFEYLQPAFDMWK